MLIQISQQLVAAARQEAALTMKPEIVRDNKIPVNSPPSIRPVYLPRFAGPAMTAA